MKPNQNTSELEIELELVKASEITPKKVEWLWYPYIPFGKVTLLQGDPGDGKSQLMLAVSALVSKGRSLPFADEEDTHEPMTVIYQTTEDDADDTVVPRFIASDGDRDKLLFIREDEKKLTFGDDRIRSAIEQSYAKLLILDPLSSYIGDDCSLNAANETRAAFNHLIGVAKETGCTIVIIAHMNKLRETSPLYRTSGSIDIAGVARSILAITRTANKENPNELVMVQVKSNLAPTGSAILFEVGENGISFLDEIEMTAEQAFASIAPKIGRPNEEFETCKNFILDLMKCGKLPSAACEELLKDNGFKKSTIKKAKKETGVVSVKEGMIWYWTLPTAEATNQEDHTKTNNEDLDFKTS